MPPGVSPEIFAPPPRPARPSPRRSANSGKPTSLPPPAPPAEPWPIAESRRARRGAERAKAEATVVITADPEPAAPNTRLRTLLLVAGGFCLLFLLAYGVPATYMWGKVLPGTRVGSVNIGGLSETQAIDRLRQRFDGNDQQVIGLFLNGRRIDTLDPRDAGLTIDAQATVAEAQTGYPSPAAVWQAMTGDRHLPLRLSLNSDKFARRIREIAKQVDRPAAEGKILYEGTVPKVIPPKEGMVLDRPATGEAIKRAFANIPASVSLIVTPDHPKAKERAFTDAMETARRAVSSPITLVNGGRSAHLSTKVIAAHLTFEADDHGTVGPRFDAAKAVAGLETRLVGVAAAPREAGFTIENGKPKLVHAHVGKGIDAAALAGAVVKVVTQGGSRTIPVSLAITRPQLTDEGALKLGVHEKVAEFTTYFPCCAPRVTNIRKAAELVDGMLVKPGETFSLNAVVGDPDPERGFVPAQSVEGDRLVVATGGGISQLAGTMYNAVFLAGLQEIDRSPHAFYISRFPAGRDATVAYPDPDLQWRNDTDNGVLIDTSVSDTSVTVALWSTKKYDRIEAETSDRTAVTQPETIYDDTPGCIPMEGGPGFTVTVVRVFYKDGKEFMRDKPRTTVYDPQPKVVCEQRHSASSEATSSADGGVDRTAFRLSDDGWEIQAEPTAATNPG
ncbi:VanW family protein [Sphaerisporangium fuscum]|uniref:VanW family protein n=1 Tax=Sphaerisporangium fuscum TaxID=2835868 RepID=UPI001BDCA122|nr:VanW family protein [Sphaerisporangium fuscum]